MKVFDENIPGFFPYNGLIGNQTVQGPNKCFSAASNGFKRHQMKLTFCAVQWLILFLKNNDLGQDTIVELGRHGLSHLEPFGSQW